MEPAPNPVEGEPKQASVFPRQPAMAKPERDLVTPISVRRLFFPSSPTIQC